MGASASQKDRLPRARLGFLRPGLAGAGVSKSVLQASRVAAYDLAPLLPSRELRRSDTGKGGYSCVRENR